MAAAVLGCPVPADREAELVGLAGRLAIKREVADLSGTATLHLLLQPGVRDDQLAVVVHVVADQRVQEAHYLACRSVAALLRKRLELCERSVEPMRDRDVTAAELADQLDVVVARHTVRGSGIDHIADQPNRVEDPGPAVDQVADEHRGATFRVGIDRASLWEVPYPPLREPVAELGQEAFDFLAAAVDVADDVERPVLVGAVVPQAGTGDRRVVDCLRRVEQVDLAESFLAHPAQAATEVLHLVADHVGAEVALRTSSVALLTQALGNVEHDRYRQEVVFARQPDELRAVLALDVRGIDDR